MVFWTSHLIIWSPEVILLNKFLIESIGSESWDPFEAFVLYHL